MEQLYQNDSTEVKFLSEYSEKDQIWDGKKESSQTVQEMYSTKAEFERLTERMGECGLSLGFSKAVNVDTGEIGYRLRTAKFCHVRNCPVCAWRRTMRNKARFLKSLPVLLERYPTHRFLFLTLTVRNCDIKNLRSVLSEMGKAWKRLINRKEFASVVGWVRTVEITYSDSKAGNAHPHYHAMIMVKPSYFSHGYIKQDAWLKAWQESMRDPEIRQVNIKAVKGDYGVKEVFKYSIKETDLVASVPWLFELTRQTHKLRFVASGGLLKDMVKEDFSTAELIVGDEPADGDDKTEETVSLLATWLPSVKRYKAEHV